MAAVLNIWIDEAFTLQSTNDGIAHALDRALTFELQPPMYFVLLTAWRTANDSLFFARLFSILCTTLTVTIVGKLSPRYLPTVPVTLVAAAVAFNPITVYAAVEARSFAFTLLLSALLLLHFYDGYLAPQASKSSRRWHILTSITALYTAYMLGFLLAAGFVTLLLLRRFTAIRHYLVSMSATAVLFAPLALTTARQVESVTNTPLVPMTYVGATRELWGRALRLILPADGILDQVSHWVSRLSAPAALVTILLRRRLPDAAILAPIIVAMVMGLLFVGTTAHLGAEFVKPQHTTALYLPILLAVLSLLKFLGGPRAAVWGAAISLGFAVICLFETYAPLAKYGDWIRVSRYIETYERPSEPILVFKAEFTLPLAYHYAGRNSIVALPRPMSEERYDLRSMVLINEGDIRQALSGRLGRERRFWLVTGSGAPFRGVDFHPEILERFVTAHCTLETDISFRETRVRRLTLRPDRATPEALAQTPIVDRRRVAVIDAFGSIDTASHDR